MDYAKESLRLHEEWKGKIRVDSAVPVKTMQDLSLAYTPGVAQPCLEIQKDVNKSYELTRRWNLCAVSINDMPPRVKHNVCAACTVSGFSATARFPLCLPPECRTAPVPCACSFHGMHSFGDHSSHCSLYGQSPQLIQRILY